MSDALSDPTGVWPTVDLDPVARLRALAAGLPGVVLHERTLDAPFDVVWGFVGDLERSVPAFDRSVASIEVLSRRGDRLRIRAASTWRLGFVPLGFDVDLTSGWCWMVSRPRLHVVGMAAVAAGPGTRYAHLEGTAVASRLLRPLLRATTVRHRRHVLSDVDGIERVLRQGGNV